MVGIVTLNPCLDKTLFLDQLPAGGIHTARRVACIAGGKGNNVARVLGALGVDCRGFVPVAGEAGLRLRCLMAEERLDAAFVELPGQTRTVTTLVGADWRQLAVKEPGPQLSDTEARMLFAEFLRFLDGVDLLALCGGPPCPTLDDFFPDAVAEARRRGIPVLLDADGAALRRGLAAGPDWCKPNEDEAAALLERPVHTPAAERAALEALYACGARRPMLSLGARGALLRDGDRLLHAVPPQVSTVNPVGSGDSFVAGFLYGVAAGLSSADCLRWAAAAGAANAAEWDAACVGRPQIEPLVSRVRVTPLS